MTTQPSSVTSALLAARLAAQQRDTAREEYRRAILEACHTGATYQELASVLGVSRQAVRQLVLTTS